MGTEQGQTGRELACAHTGTHVHAIDRQWASDSLNGITLMPLQRYTHVVKPSVNDSTADRPLELFHRRCARSTFTARLLSSPWQNLDPQPTHISQRSAAPTQLDGAISERQYAPRDYLDKIVDSFVSKVDAVLGFYGCVCACACAYIPFRAAASRVFLLHEITAPHCWQRREETQGQCDHIRLDLLQ